MYPYQYKTFFYEVFEFGFLLKPLSGLGVEVFSFKVRKWFEWPSLVPGPTIGFLHCRLTYESFV